MVSLGQHILRWILIKYRRPETLDEKCQQFVVFNLQDEIQKWSIRDDFINLKVCCNVENYFSEFLLTSRW